MTARGDADRGLESSAGKSRSRRTDVGLWQRLCDIELADATMRMMCNLLSVPDCVQDVSQGELRCFARVQFLGKSLAMIEICLQLISLGGVPPVSSS